MVVAIMCGDVVFAMVGVVITNCAIAIASLSITIVCVVVVGGCSFAIAGATAIDIAIAIAIDMSGVIGLFCISVAAVAMDHWSWN